MNEKDQKRTQSRKHEHIEVIWTKLLEVKLKLIKCFICVEFAAKDKVDIDEIVDERGRCDKLAQSYWRVDGQWGTGW